MILLPGMRSLREFRRSQLAFMWDAKDADLLPVTGQEPQLTGTPAVGTVGGNIVPGVGTTVATGKGMPRFGRDPSLGANHLALAGSGIAGQDAEALTYFASLPARDCTVLMRLTGIWTPGFSFASQGGLFALGNQGLQGAGTLLLYRLSTNWILTRSYLGSNSSANLAENAGLVWPADALIVFTGSTGGATLSLRGANGTIYGPLATGTAAGYSQPNKRWGGDVICVGNAGIYPGANLKLYLLKIAMGIKSYADMDGLS